MKISIEKTEKGKRKLAQKRITLINTHKVNCFILITPEDMQIKIKQNVYTKPYMQMFIVASFIIAQAWKQPRCPSVGEWVNKLVHPGNGILVLKRNEVIKP